MTEFSGQNDDSGVERRTAFLGLTALVLVAAAVDIGSESLSLQSYYPSPLGIYSQLTTTAATTLARDSGSVIVGSASNPANLTTWGTLYSNQNIQATGNVQAGGTVYAGTSYMNSGGVVTPGTVYAGNPAVAGGFSYMSSGGVVTPGTVYAGNTAAVNGYSYMTAGGVVTPGLVSAGGNIYAGGDIYSRGRKLPSLSGCYAAYAYMYYRGGCGEAAQVYCQSGYYAVSGGSSGGNNALQDLTPIISGGYPVGWAVEFYDISGQCGLNPVSAYAWALCCQ